MHLLTDTAFDILVTELERHGNVLSTDHKSALLELLDTFTAYVEGHVSGLSRKAFGLPTGMGKTTAIAAFTAAMARLERPEALAVAASKVEALCSLKRTLIDLGVPPDRIGLRHSLLTASEPSTGNASYHFQLVTHQRVRSGRDVDFRLFGFHEGRPRSLLIYDETMFRSHVLSVDARTVRSALGALLPYIEGDRDQTLRLAFDYLNTASKAIDAAATTLKDADDPHSSGTEVTLDDLTDVQQEAYAKAIQASRLASMYVEALENLLTISQEPLRVVTTAQGDGVVWIADAIPRDLRNVVVLDASAPVRRLAQMDSSVQLMDGFPVETVKTFDAVEVVQIVSGGGRSTIEQAAQDTHKSPLSQEVVALVRENWKIANAILIFTFKERGAIDLVERLRRDLAAAGFNPESLNAEGKHRIRFLTWGDETSLNGFEYCDVVIMAGVLQQSHLTVAAQVRGQLRHPKMPTPNDLVQEIIESEVAHLIYQGASRGSCRRTVDGRAAAMRLYFVHRHRGIQELLDPVMPGARWSLREPTYLKAAQERGVVDGLAAQLLAYLRDVPQSDQKVSSKKIKAALQVPDNEAAKKAFTRAMDVVVDGGRYGWAIEGRSLVRTGFGYYFGEDRE
jgi:hypothetical protein